MIALLLAILALGVVAKRQAVASAEPAGPPAEGAHPATLLPDFSGSAISALPAWLRGAGSRPTFNPRDLGVDPTGGGAKPLLPTPEGPFGPLLGVGGLAPGVSPMVSPPPPIQPEIIPSSGGMPVLIQPTGGGSVAATTAAALGGTVYGTAPASSIFPQPAPAPAPAPLAPAPTSSTTATRTATMVA